MNADSTLRPNTPSTPSTPTAGSAGAAASASTAAGDGLVRAGAILFALGAVATVATVLPLFLGLHRLPSAAYFVCMAMPLGFAIALTGLFRSARAQRRQAPEK